MNGHTTVAHRINAFRADTVDVALHRLEHTPPEFGRIIFVPDRTASSTIEALERSATVAPVDQVTATDVREMFEHHSAR